MLYLGATVLFVAVVACIVAVGIVIAMQLGDSREQRQRYARIAAIGLGSWLLLTGALAAGGLVSDFSSFPPRVMPIIVASLVIVIVIAASPLGGKIMSRSPLAFLVGFHVFRVAVEVVLFLLERAGIVPVQMSFEGRNWDILAGLTAPLVALLIARKALPNWGLLLWNLVSLGLLTNIVVIALLSMPTPFRVFLNEPANTFITTLPYIWLPTLLVPAALFGHLLVFRRLLTAKRAPVAQPLAH